MMFGSATLEFIHAYLNHDAIEHEDLRTLVLTVSSVSLIVESILHFSHELHNKLFAHLEVLHELLTSGSFISLAINTAFYDRTPVWVYVVAPLIGIFAGYNEYRKIAIGRIQDYFHNKYKRGDSTQPALQKSLLSDEEQDLAGNVEQKLPSGNHYFHIAQHSPTVFGERYGKLVRFVEGKGKDYSSGTEPSGSIGMQP